MLETHLKAAKPIYSISTKAEKTETSTGHICYNHQVIVLFVGGP